MEFYQKKHHIGNRMLSAERKLIKGRFERHGHEFFEIEYIINGSGKYCIDGVEYDIEKNMLFFMSPAGFHELETDGADIINVMFPCSLADDEILFGIFALGRGAAVKISENDREFVLRLLTEVVRFSKSEKYIYAVEFLRCLLYFISDVLHDEISVTSSHIKSAIIYILSNFRNGVTLEETAKYLGLAPAYLSTLFLQETGENFKSYVDNLKFEYAIRLLGFTDLTIAEICTQSGFCDYANFIRRFTKRYGVAPNTYRKSGM